ncbi:sugar transferase [Dysgonomonas sp. ZJ279]|uniref:sugar transferase n=1 Tax=Dysgonomonas sp. ZJ279 TaxID=2709796 RepID=UPI0013EBAFCE|nr:sugar transferase [Dysgonomonas sp. ZJ279]
MDILFGRKGFRILIPLIDIAFIYLSILLSYYLFKDTLNDFTGNYYAFLSIWPYIGICYLILSHIFELDKPKDFSLIGVGYTVSLTILSLLGATMAISFLAREFAYPRSILLFSSGLQIIVISLWHWFTNKMYRRANEKKTVVIIGYQKSKDLAYKLLESNGMWSRILHICEPANPKVYEYINECDVTFLTEDVDENIKQNLVRYCVNENKIMLYEPKNPEILLFNARFIQIDDTPVLDVKELGIQPGSEIIKRIMDIVLGSLAVVVFAIPFIVVYLTLKITGGTAFYVQERITRGGKIFKIYKFRTMVENAEAKSGPVLAQDVDKRITKLGHILRATRIDEVPQVFNILKGDMSIVGPRPERPFFVEQFCKELPEYNLRHRVKAGLTGMAQVQGRYNTTVGDKLKYDLLYINGYSLVLDIKLVMQTLNILLRKSSTQGLKDEKNFGEEIKKLSRG